MSSNAFDAIERQTTEDQAYREHAAWERSKVTTLCWQCNAPYPITDACCPKCYAFNGNITMAND